MAANILYYSGSQFGIKRENIQERSCTENSERGMIRRKGITLWEIDLH